MPQGGLFPGAQRKGRREECVTEGRGILRKRKVYGQGGEDGECNHVLLKAEGRKRIQIRKTKGRV